MRNFWPSAVSEYSPVLSVWNAFQHHIIYLGGVDRIANGSLCWKAQAQLQIAMPNQGRDIGGPNSEALVIIIQPQIS